MLVVSQKHTVWSLFVAKPWMVVHTGPLFQNEVLKTPDGQKDWERTSRPPGSRTIILSKDKSKILLTKEKRPEHGEEPDWRLPGGMVADTWDEYQSMLESGEDIAAHALAGAIRESREEAGIVIVTAELIEKTPCGGKIAWDLYYFEAREWYEHPDGQELGDDEDIVTEWIAVSEVPRLIYKGHLKEDRTAAVLLRYLHKNCLITL